jgi:hypothetical protein
MADKIISTVKRERERDAEGERAAAIERLYLRVSFVFANS